MAEHSELVNEMAILEKIATSERLKMAKKRRLQQLKKWSQREKELNNINKKNKKSDSNGPDDKNETKRKKTERVHFVSSVMLLEAAARNDIEEGSFLENKSQTDSTLIDFSFSSQFVDFYNLASIQIPQMKTD